MKNTPFQSCFKTPAPFLQLSHRPLLVFVLLFSITICFSQKIASAFDPTITNLGDPNVRAQLVEQLARQSQQKKLHAASIAQLYDWPVREQINQNIFELMAIDDYRIYTYKTCNINAAISIGADLIRNTPPYDLNGTGLTAGLWDGGAARDTHQEFGARINIIDSVSYSDHSTHVAGTIAAAGIVTGALGMAPNALIDSYEWNSDASEMASRAMTYPHEPGTIQISNHSYGFIIGWENSFLPPRWYGIWGQREDALFGMYNTDTADWDSLCYNAPYFLPFKAAGNDRSDNAPTEGQTFAFYDPPPPKWQTKTYDPCTDPYDDGYDNGGFDTIMTVGNAKNIMTIGAVDDAVLAGLRDPQRAAMSVFSGWGPTDDGRIKPDIVTNGIGLYSPTAASDATYASYSGTSMASPGAAGAAILLTEYYNRLFPADAMRASTIKALLIHTADDLGNPGPDYKFGFGLLNALAAANLIADQNDFSDADIIVENLLDDVDSIHTYQFQWDRVSPIRATLCWTDPPAAPLEELDNPSPRLINDLDLRVIDPYGGVFYPYVLNPASPNDIATTADNVLDNVEQIEIPFPNLVGTYTLSVTCKGTLTNSQQYYSLILTGRLNDPSILPDFNRDGLFNLIDLKILADNWLNDNPLTDIAPETSDGVTNFLDFAEFAENFNL
ncbi:MAG: S8 family serine peptidase [Sedimentisphaerales bacterium]|nr:S8 family serine peptidase [Sedimentisphaerales bacterium]